MTEPQVWTIIAVMSATLFGVITLITTMFARLVKTEIGGVGTEIGGVRTEIGGLRTEIQSLHFRFDSIDKRIDNLDRDVQFLMRREIDRGD